LTKVTSQDGDQYSQGKGKINKKSYGKLAPLPTERRLFEIKGARPPRREAQGEKSEEQRKTEVPTSSAAVLKKRNQGKGGTDKNDAEGADMAGGFFRKGLGGKRRKGGPNDIHE